MEYLPHGDMEEYLQTSKLSESETQEVTFQLLEGLSFMHKNGFVHRDVKPNVSRSHLVAYHFADKCEEHSYQVETPRSYLVGQNR